MKRNVQIALIWTILNFFAFGSLAWADLTYKDWTVNELLEDPLLKVPSCHAFTNIADSEFPVELSLTFPKNLSKAPVAFIKIDPSLNATQVLIKTSSRETEVALALTMASDGAQTSYWYIPMNMDRLVSKIAAANYLEIIIQTQDAEAPVRVSLAGSSKILQETKRCVGGSDLFSEDFFEDLVDKDAQAYPVEGEVTLERAFDFFQTAYLNHQAAAEAKTNLDALRRENRHIIREEAAAQKEYDSAKSKLDQAQEALNINDQQRTENQKLIQEKQTLLNQLAPQKLAAEQDLAKKKATYEPLRQEAKQYAAKIDRAESAISSAQSRIRSLKNDISSAESEIDNLEREAANLESQVRRYESDLSGLERELSSAESRYRNYDENREARQILESDFRYRSAKSDLQNNRQKLQQARQDLQRARPALQQAKQKLQQCTQDPTRNCSAEQADVSRAQNEFDAAKREVNQAERQVQRNQDDIQRLEWSAQNEAGQQKQRLANEVSQISSEVSRLESQISSSRSRIRSIFDYEIPSRNQIISSAQNEIPRQERSLSSARRDLSAAQKEYAEFKTRTNYDQIRQAYTQAQKALESIVDQIEAAEAEIASAQRKITRLDRDRPSLVTNLDRRKVAADQKQQKLTEVQSRMGEFKANETALVQTLETALAQFDLARGLYKTIVLEILN